MTLVYVIAGEESGDVLGAKLMAALKAARPGLDFAGIGGPRMVAEGMAPLFAQRELAVMGLLEVLPKIRQLRARLQQTIADILARRPAVLVTIDSPGFTLRVLRGVEGCGIARAHYVAPQVWAWREGRVKHFPGLWEKLLCLLPFEPAFFARHGLAAIFVGHPVLEAGLDRLVKMESRDFIGRGALEAAGKADPKWKLVVLDVDAKDSDAFTNGPIFANGTYAGVVASGGYGHSVKKSIALAYVAPNLAAPGTKLQVEILGDLHSATVCEGALYDPKNEKLRA